MVCRGKIAKESASYTPSFCKLFWDSISEGTPGLFTCLKRDRFCGKTGVPLVGTPTSLQTIHEELPLPAMITRSIPMSSPEARTPQAKAARDKELGGHKKRGTWDLETVRE